jgi:hypothetical protein
MTDGFAFTENDRLFLHRSWTGYGVYEAVFARDANGQMIVEAIVCGDVDKYSRRSNHDESAQLCEVINWVLLNDSGYGEDLSGAR